MSKAFSASIEVIIWLLFFYLLIWCITLIDFVDTEESLHPWDKAHLVKMYDLFNVLLDSNSFCIYFDGTLFSSDGS